MWKFLKWCLIWFLSFYLGSLIILYIFDINTLEKYKISLQNSEGIMVWGVFIGYMIAILPKVMVKLPFLRSEDNDNTTKQA